MNEIEKLTEIEKLEQAKSAAWREYQKLVGPFEAASKKYDECNDALKAAQLYEKAKRHVMRDLIKAAGKVND
jgi:hypothetical protein